MAVAKSIRGEFICNIGNPSHRFYLGFNEKEAEDRKGQLKLLWKAESHENWQPFTLFLGKAIAKGQAKVAVDDWITRFADDPLGKAHALTNLRN